MTEPRVTDAVLDDGWIEVTVSDGEHTVTSRQPLGYDGVQEKAIAEFHRVVEERGRKDAQVQATAMGRSP